MDYLIPIRQDSTRRAHPHTAYEEWNKLLLLNRMDAPTHGGRHRGAEGWGKRRETSDHWWMAIPRTKLQGFLRLLREDARRIFDQRWIIAWTGEKVFELGDTVKTRPK